MSVQRADGRPGHYYVTARDGDRVAFLLGPFTQEKPGTLAHRKALGAVTVCRRKATQIFSSAAFATFGTSRLDLDAERVPVGRLGRVRLEVS